MEISQRIPALLNYILPVIGWIYVGIFHRKNPYALFHLRQSLALFIFLGLITLCWVVVGWVIAWIPYAFVLSIVLFTLPFTAYILGVILWVIGMVNALLGRRVSLPFVGGIVGRLPF